METTITRNQVIGFREAAKVALAELASKHGLRLAKAAPGRFTEQSVTLGFDFEAAGSDPAEVRYWKMFTPILNLRPEWLGATVTMKGVQYVVRGLEVRPRKGEVIVLARVGDTNPDRSFTISAPAFIVHMERGSK